MEVLWAISTFIQELLGFGTAYRLTKRGGDNGISLFGWLFLMHLAALIPGLGIYIWFKCKETEDLEN